MFERFKFWGAKTITLEEIKAGEAKRAGGVFALPSASVLDKAGLNVKQSFDWRIVPYGDLVLSDSEGHIMGSDRDFFQGEPVRLRTRRMSNTDYATFRTQG